ncbi:hypothetical protein LXL04_031070 [Taraxacum kok-saghyz]
MVTVTNTVTVMGSGMGTVTGTITTIVTVMWTVTVTVTFTVTGTATVTIRVTGYGYSYNYGSGYRNGDSPSYGYSYVKLPNSTFLPNRKQNNNRVPSVSIEIRRMADLHKVSAVSAKQQGEAMAETIPFKNLHSREYQGHKKKVHSVAWNCSGTKLASGSVDQTARVWQIEPHGHVSILSKVKDVELKGHTDSVDQLCWDPKHGDLIATASGDKTVRLWDVRSGKCSQQAELSGENINITYKPDGTHVAVGNRDDELTILDVRKFKPIHKRKFNYEVNEIAWNMSGDMFFLTTGNGTVEVLGYPSLQAVDTLTAHTAGCYCIAIDPFGRYFAVGSADSLVSLWNISEMLCVRTFTKLEWPVRTISFNHTGDYIASASEDLFIDIVCVSSCVYDMMRYEFNGGCWQSNVESGRSVHQIPCRAAMNSVEWNPKYNLLAYAGDDKNKYQADEGVFRIFGFENA